VQQAREILAYPPDRSESQPLFGQDPVFLAKSALDCLNRCKDAGAQSAQLFYNIGLALRILGHNKEAMEELAAAYQRFPEDSLIAKALEEAKVCVAAEDERIENTNRGKKRSVSECRVGEPLPSGLDASFFECSLCLRVFHQPVTTPCGHTFCKTCLARSYDMLTKCPICRTALYMDTLIMPVSVTIQSLLEKYFPEELAARQLEESPVSEDDSSMTLPLFVMDVLFPDEEMALNIFEPRYRLMIRRCIMSNRMLGMSTRDQSNNISHGCMVNIKDLASQPDGRFHIEVVGKQRFEVLSTSDLDGYLVARVRFFSDDPPSPSEEQAMETKRKELEAFLTGWKQFLRVFISAQQGRMSLGWVDFLSGESAAYAGSDMEGFSFWLAKLIPMPSAARLEVLAMRNTMARLRCLHELMVRLRQTIMTQ